MWGKSSKLESRIQNENESRRRRPCKVWDHNRTTRKSIIVAGLPELIVRGKEALGFGVADNVRVAVEEDGTEVEDIEYFQTLPDNTVFLLLRDGEKWVPRPEETKKNAELQLIKAVIPKAIQEAVPALGLREEAPTWQLADHKGLITIFLEWDLRATRPGYVGDRPSLTLTSADLSASAPSLSAVQSSARSAFGRETFINHVAPTAVSSLGTSSTLPSIHVSSGLEQMSRGSHFTLARSPRHGVSPSIDAALHGSSGDSGHSLLPGFVSSSSSSSAFLSALTTSPSSVMHHHHHHAGHGGGNGSQCDFHCCALHQAASGQFHGITPTSVVPTVTSATLPPPVGYSSTLPSSMAHQRSRSYDAGHHVHFSKTEREYLNDGTAGSTAANTGSISTVVSSASGRGPLPPVPGSSSSALFASSAGQRTTGSNGGDESSESETENADASEAGGDAAPKRAAQKILVLSDRVTPDHRRHLTVRDLGVILDRLNSRISDVEALTREVINSELYHWQIRATVKGDTMRNLGVLYQGNYYLIREQQPIGGTRASSSAVIPSAALSSSVMRGSLLPAPRSGSLPGPTGSGGGDSEADTHI